ncbi:hypothetical protein CSC35_1440 [Enterobacter hormaechei]|nr:hypothetical protein CSC35_1440 [Enterobacter hormaechei]
MIVIYFSRCSSVGCSDERNIVVNVKIVVIAAPGDSDHFGIAKKG